MGKVQRIRQIKQNNTMAGFLPATGATGIPPVTVARPERAAAAALVAAAWRAAILAAPLRQHHHHIEEPHGGASCPRRAATAAIRGSGALAASADGLATAS